MQVLVAIVGFFGIATCIAALVVLTSDVPRQIEALATANSDSAHFTIAQLDVEFLSLQIEVEKAIHNDGNLSEVRRRFDIFYGRTQMLATGSAFDFLRNQQQVAADLSVIRNFAIRTVPMIDANDAELSDHLPRMATALEQLRPIIRRAALRATTLYSEAADARRANASATLMNVVWLTLGLVAVLFVMVGFLSFLVRQTRTRAQALSVATTRLAAIIGSSLDAVLVIDREGMIADYNGAAEALFGRSTRDALGKPLAQFVVPPDSGATCALGFALTQEGLARVTGLRADGTPFPAECSVVETKSDEGVIYVSFVRDISQRLAAEQELVEARDRALAGEKAKSDLLAVMSHEMRTPLNGMLGTTELLGDTALDERQRNLVGIIARSGKLLMRHVNDVLDISRLEAGKMPTVTVPFDATDLLQGLAETAGSQADAAGNRLTVEAADPRLRRMLGDPNKIEHILTNLLGNANKFTRDGHIHLSARIGEDGMVEFAVRDNGIGIAMEDQMRIFEDFVTLDASYSRSSEGTGLGLSISQRLARAMKGTLEVQSKLGEGSEFRIRLPFREAPPEALAKAAAASVDRPAVRSLDILVVEDNEINRFVVGSMLRGDGHRVTEAHDGRLGVAAAAERRYDLILMDISMPELDGTEATRLIRDGMGPCHDVPIIALTAHALPADLDRFRDAGMTRALTKPLDRNLLRQMLADVAAGPADAPAEPPPRKPRASRSATRPAAPRKRAVKGPPPVDFSQPDSLVDGLGPEVFRGLLARYLSESEAGLAELKAGADAGADPVELAAQAHKLAGTAAMFGATGLRAALVALETDVKTGSTDTVGIHAEAALAIWPATRAAYGRY